MSSSPSENRSYVVRSGQLALRALDYRDVTRVTSWLQDTAAMRDVLPLHLTSQEFDVVSLIEHSKKDGPLMAWALDLIDETPIGIANWREDLPWQGVFHLEVIVSSIAPQRFELVGEAYRLLARHVFGTLPARKVTAKVGSEASVGTDALQAAGMVQEGVLRAHSVLDGIEQDLHLFGMSRSEWAAHVNL